MTAQGSSKAAGQVIVNTNGKTRVYEMDEFILTEGDEFKDGNNELHIVGSFRKRSIRKNRIQRYAE